MKPKVSLLKSQRDFGSFFKHLDVTDVNRKVKTKEHRDKIWKTIGSEVRSTMTIEVIQQKKKEAQEKRWAEHLRAKTALKKSRDNKIKRKSDKITWTQKYDNALKTKGTTKVRQQETPLSEPFPDTGGNLNDQEKEE
jgi:hypothetical protein